MKYVVIFISLILGAGIGTSTAEVEQENPLRVYYTASSRGYYYEIALQEPVIKVFHTMDRQVSAESKLSEETWTELRGMLSEIALGDLKNINTSLKGSASDRSAIAQVRVCHGGKSHQSPEFDKDSPPDVLKPLIQKMQSLAVIVESEQ